MCTGYEADGIIIEEKPQVFLKSVTFNDNTSIKLEQNSIIVFTGANNSGKSQVLKDIEHELDKSDQTSAIIINKIEFDYYGSINESQFFNEHFKIDHNGYYHFPESNNGFTQDMLKNYWKSHTLYNELHKLFIKRLSTEIRLTSSNALNRHSNPEKHPIYKLNNNERLSQKLSDYFRQAFGVDLIINRNEMQTIPLHIGQAPDKEAFTIATQDDYYNQISTLPKLQDQGDGMRSFASILLDTFTSDYPITLIDEPEAFLHPPQARILGKMLANNSRNNRQLFISTHSEDFLQGLLDAENENVTIIRINREDNVNHMSILYNEEIRKLWSNPLLRYSNILSGLFHEKVVVCESDYDCLFYQAIIDAVCEHNNEIAPDILFTHCGGKARVKDVVSALRAVDVPVVAICDFDLINSKQVFKPIIEAFEVDWTREISSDMQIIYDSINARNRSHNDVWTQLKKIGKAGLLGDEPAAYSRVEAICKSAGLFIVPVGEMECFYKTINKEKKDWVYHVLENYDLAIEPNLEEARKFVQSVVNFKPSSYDK